MKRGDNMAVFEKFPYTNFHELNLDWIIEIVKTLDNTVSGLETEKENKGQLTYNGTSFPFTVEPLTLTDGNGHVTTYNIVVAEV